MIFAPNIYQPKLCAVDFSVDSTKVHGYTKFTKTESIDVQMSFSPESLITAPINVNYLVEIKMFAIFPNSAYLTSFSFNSRITNQQRLNDTLLFLRLRLEDYWAIDVRFNRAEILITETSGESKLIPIVIGSPYPVSAIVGVIQMYLFDDYKIRIQQLPSIITDFESYNTGLAVTLIPHNETSAPLRTIPLNWVRTDEASDGKLYFHLFGRMDLSDIPDLECGCYYMVLSHYALDASPFYEWDVRTPLEAPVSYGLYVSIQREYGVVQSTLTTRSLPVTREQIRQTYLSSAYSGLNIGVGLYSLQTFSLTDFGTGEAIRMRVMAILKNNPSIDQKLQILYWLAENYLNSEMPVSVLGSLAEYVERFEFNYDPTPLPKMYNPDRVLANSEIFEILDKPDRTVLINFKHDKDLLGTMFENLETDYKFRVAGVFRKELPEWGGSNEEFSTYDNRNIRLSGYPTEIFTLTLGTLRGLPRETVTKIFLALQCRYLIINGIPCKMVAGQSELDIVERYMNGNTIFNIKVQPAENKYISGSAKTALHAGGQTPYIEFDKTGRPFFV